MGGENDATRQIILAGATALAAGAAAMAYTHVTKKSECDAGAASDVYFSCVVFLDGAEQGVAKGRAVRHPRFASTRDLIAAAGAALGITNTRLFLESTREELLPHPDARAALEAASCGARRLVLLIATAGAPLSDAAASLPRLAAPPAGPRPLPVIGNALCFRSGPYEIPMYNLYHHVFAPGRGYGDTVLLRLPEKADFSSSDGAIGDPQGAGGWDDIMALRETVFTTDPDIAAELLVRQEDFPKIWNRGQQKVISQFTGIGIFTSSTTDPDWASAHGLMPRFFNALKIKNYYPIILDKTRVFMHEWNKLAAKDRGQGALVEGVNDWFACMTADAVVKCSMGLDMRNVERKGNGEPLHPLLRVFRQGVHALFGHTDLKQEMGASYYNPFASRKAATQRAIQRSRQEAEDLVADIIEKTRRGEIGGGTSMVAAMLNDKAPNTGEYVRLQTFYGHIINLLIAGHETTATTLAWTLYYLGLQPDCEAKALQEIKDVLGDRSEPTADDIPKLVYLEACFREALRLRPAVTAVARDAAADTLVKGKWLVRRGQRITLNLYGIHRREDLWGGPFGDPETFNPERFMPGACERLGLPPRHPQAFLPWGFGVRSCIGQLFALWEAKAFLCMLLPRFKLRSRPGYVPVASNREGGATPLPHGLAFYVHQRPNAPAVSEPSAAADAGPTAVAPAAAPAAPAAPAGEGHGTPLSVLYGSNSGMCEDLAQQAAAKARGAGFATTVSTLDQAAAAAGAAGGSLPTAGAVVIVTSTYNGMPPDNAAAFSKWLDAAAPGGQAGVKFCVLGVGNSQWAGTFQAFPKKVDAALAGAGATALLPLVTVDVDQAGVTDVFEDWGDTLVSALLSAFQVASSAPAAGPGPAAPPRVALEAVPSGVTPEADLSFGNDVTGDDLRAIVKLAKARAEARPGVITYHPLEVLVSEELLPPDSARHTRHVELALPPGVDYTAGDHLEVIPTNSPFLVDAALHVLGLSGDERFVWTAGAAPGAARGFGSVSAPKSLGDNLPGLRLCLTARAALTYLADLSAAPPRKLVAALAESCPCPPEAAALRRLAGEEGYAAEVAAKKLTLVELLGSYRSVGYDLKALINTLPRLAPRYYSISSSPLADPRRCSITVGLVSFATPSGRAHTGAASGLIHSREAGGVLIGTVRCLQSTFKLPKDPATPVIMIGPGTGLAPMMGFCQEREMLLSRKKAALGPALLFFGCRSASEDYIYRERLEGYARSGVLTGLHVAFSRDGPSKVYVQDLIVQQGREVWALMEAGARVYVCGDARRMAPDVRRAFLSVAREHGGRSEASALSWMGALTEAGRYLEDVWAG